MPLEVDHLFLCTSAGAPEVEQLAELGLSEGRSNQHTGQGTACRRFFFRNSYLEFLWVHDEQEARSELVRPLHLLERWRHRRTGHSPFGLALRPSKQTNEPGRLPFPTWEYRPPYLPDSLHIDVAENSVRPAEPLIFHLPFGDRPDACPVERRQPLEHRVGFKEITELSISLPEKNISKVLESVGGAGTFKLIPGEAHLAEVIFDEGARAKFKDFRPALPLIFRW